MGDRGVTSSPLHLKLEKNLRGAKYKKGIIFFDLFTPLGTSRVNTKERKYMNKIILRLRWLLYLKKEGLNTWKMLFKNLLRKERTCI